MKNLYLAASVFTVLFSAANAQTVSNDLTELMNAANEVNSITISPVTYEGKNVFAKYEMGYYQGIKTKESYEEYLKEQADQVCEFLGFKESSDNQVVYRKKPQANESKELVSIFDQRTYEREASYTHADYEIKPFELFERSEYYDFSNEATFQSVGNTAAMVIALPFQLGKRSFHNVQKRKYGIFSKLTCTH